MLNKHLKLNASIKLDKEPSYKISCLGTKYES